MRVEEGKYSIAEMADWYKRAELVPNKDYQRGAGLWPPSAKSYFIDTILKEYPFPKIYFHERLDLKTKRPRREIVDGQQRMTTIVDYIDNKFALGRNAVGLEGKKFDQLTEEQQLAFYSYTVSVDVIRNADRAEILQMFRRMNAYTLPLNAPEKRHSEFFGAFKDWVNNFLDRYGAVLVDWKIFSTRQIVRMADAEFVSDLALALEEGIVSTSPQKLRNLYKRYDLRFDMRDQWDELLTRTFDTILSELSELQGTYITRPHVFHSLICALLHRYYGLPGVEEATGCRTEGNFFRDREAAVASLQVLAAAHEGKDTGELSPYVQAASEGGNRAAQRIVRIQWLSRALEGHLV